MMGSSGETVTALQRVGFRVAADADRPVLLPVARVGWWRKKRMRCLLRWLLLGTACLLIRCGCLFSTVCPRQGMDRPRGGGPSRTNRLWRPEPGPVLSKISSWSS